MRNQHQITLQQLGWSAELGSTSFHAGPAQCVLLTHCIQLKQHPQQQASCPLVRHVYLYSQLPLLQNLHCLQVICPALTFPLTACSIQAVTVATVTGTPTCRHHRCTTQHHEHQRNTFCGVATQAPLRGAVHHTCAVQPQPGTLCHACSNHWQVRRSMLFSVTPAWWQMIFATCI
jgi:hypothetical protein